jgi:hypothetical protein
MHTVSKHQSTLTCAKNSKLCMHEQRERDSPSTGWRHLHMSSAHSAASGIRAECGHPQRAGADTAARRPHMRHASEARPVRSGCLRLSIVASARGRYWRARLSLPRQRPPPQQARMLSEACTRCCDKLRYSANSCPVLPAALP